MADETKNAAREALAEVLEQEYGCKSGMVHEGYGAECASSAHAPALYRTFGCDHVAHVADAILASPALDAIVAERVAALAEEMPPRMAEAWGGDSRWLTTGSNVAALVGDWLREEAADLAERTAER